MRRLFILARAFFRFILDALIIRPFLILANLGLLGLQGALLGILVLGHSRNGYLHALVRAWAAGSWFQVSRGIISYLPEFLVSRLHGLWLGSLDRERRRHTYILGGSGSGKSATLESFLYRDVKKGHGLALIEPHGELTERFLHFDLFRLDHPFQAHRRLVLFDLESSNPTPFNLFRVALPELGSAERQIRIDEVISSYMPAFQMAITPEMTEHMAAMLRNVLTAVFELRDPGFLDVIGMLGPEETLKGRYRDLIRSLGNPVLRNYFQIDFLGRTVERSKAPLRNRLQNLLVQRQLQRSLLARDNGLDFDAILREGKVLVLKASKERVGAATARMIGNLLHQGLYAAALRRNLKAPLIPFFCVMDECQNYVNATVLHGLAEARKFGFHYMLANQYLGQAMSREQQKALLSCRVKLCGAVNAEDATEMARQMNIESHKRHLRVLKPGEFYVHKGEPRARFIKFPRTFTLPTAKVGRGRHGVYMSDPDYRALLDSLRTPNQSDPLTYPDAAGSADTFSSSLGHAPTHP